MVSEAVARGLRSSDFTVQSNNVMNNIICHLYVV